jgi:hypothetical protein
MSLHDDDERDAWLAQALRHAPDASADAPRALSDTILREARAAAVQSAVAAPPPRRVTVSPMQWLASVWDWLARPPIAAGFASVMVATLVGVMWWDKPLDETLPRTPEVVSSTPQAQAEAAPPAVVAAAPAAPEVQAGPAAPASPKPADARRAPAAQGRLGEMKDAEKSARASRPTDELTRLRGADAAPAAVLPPVAFPAAVAPAPQAATTTNEAPSPLAQRRELVVPATKAAAESSGQAMADKAAPLRNDLRALQGSASPSLAKARVADAGDAPLIPLLNQIAQQPERWRWQRGPGSPQPMNAAVQRWLAELDRQTGSRWQAGAGSAAREPASSLRLFRDGVLQATLGFVGGGVGFEAAGAPASLAPLPDGTAESLRKALEDATP